MWEGVHKIPEKETNITCKNINGSYRKNHKSVKCTKIDRDGASSLIKSLWMEEISLNCSQYLKTKKIVLFLKFQWQDKEKYPDNYY